MINLRRQRWVLACIASTILLGLPLAYKCLALPQRSLHITIAENEWNSTGLQEHRAYFVDSGALGIMHNNYDFHRAAYARRLCIRSSSHDQDGLRAPKELFVLVENEEEKALVGKAAQRLLDIYFNMDWAKYTVSEPQIESTLQNITWVKGLTYMVNTGTPVTGHPAHWAMKWALLLSFYASKEAYPTLRSLGMFQTVQMLHTPRGLSSFEEGIMATAIRAISHITHSDFRSPSVRFSDDLLPSRGEESKITCFAEALLVNRLEYYFAGSRPAEAWNTAADQELHLKTPPVLCKPQKVVIVAREEHAQQGDSQHNSRPLWNLAAVVNLLRSKGLAVEVAYVSGKWSFRSQAALFRSADIIISAHSSQLANLLFSRPGTTAIELMPYKFDNRVFERLGLAMGVDYRVLSCPLPTQSPRSGDTDEFSHLSTKECMQHFACRALHRNIGVEADLVTLEREIDDVVQKRLEACKIY